MRPRTNRTYHGWVNNLFLIVHIQPDSCLSTPICAARRFDVPRGRTFTGSEMMQVPLTSPVSATGASNPLSVHCYLPLACGLLPPSLCPLLSFPARSLVGEAPCIQQCWTGSERLNGATQPARDSGDDAHTRSQQQWKGDSVRPAVAYTQLRSLSQFTFARLLEVGRNIKLQRKQGAVSLSHAQWYNT